MLKAKILLVAILISTLFISCASTPNTPKETPKPNWVDNPNSEFPEEDFIALVGNGYSKAEAAADAEQELGNYFGHNVKSTVTGTESFGGNDKDGYERNRNITKEYIITLDVDLFAVAKTKPWYDVDSELYYVCAYLDRFKAFDVYKPTVIEAKNDFYGLYNEIDNEKDFFKKLNLLKETQIVASQYSEVLNFAQAILPNIADLYRQDFADISSVNVMMKQLQNSASVKVEVDNDYSSKIKDYVSSVFSDNGFSIAEKNYKFLVKVSVDENKQVDDVSGIIVSDPSITISLVDNNSDEIGFTYTRNFERVKAYNEATIERKAFAAIENELNSSFESELNLFLQK